jgi:multidrug transporter EmrE-like cation transporter
MTRGGLEQVGVVTRPGSVVWYERLAWATFAVGLASAAASRATLAKYYDRYPISYPIIIAVVLAGQLLWIWLVARKRQNWARWISLIVILFGIPNAIWDVEERFRLNAVAAIFYYAAFAISTVSILLLFRGDAREWFSRKRFASGA